MQRSVLPRLGTRDLAHRTADGTVVVDVRPPDAYNGWPLRGEARGGHVAGARSLPAKWCDYLDWIEVVRAKGIRPEHRVVLYGYDDEAERAARRFLGSGWNDVAVYPHFVDEWSADASLPMDRLARWNHLVPPSWLSDRIEEGSIGADDGHMALLHTHYRNPDDYAIGHVPGALEVDTNSLESTETWNRRSPEEVAEVLADLGITADTTVVLYGRCSHPRPEDPFPGSSAGHIAAFRCAWILLWAGVRDVRILDGGLQSWIDNGRPVSTEPSPAPTRREFGRTLPAEPDLAVDLDEARHMLASDTADLVCVRSEPEYRGEVSGYDYIERRGRIPGAVFGHCGSDAYHMENYRNLDHTTREFHEVESAWTAAGLAPGRRTAFYCGTGWRGSEAFFNAWFQGWPDVAVFDGGWFEWSNDPSNPVEAGN